MPAPVKSVLKASCIYAWAKQVTRFLSLLLVRCEELMVSSAQGMETRFLLAKFRDRHITLKVVY